tara:strand:+ start:4985 stop:5977 length:993 start_codon:yes stop_codon:yes gene_type:complete
MIFKSQLLERNLKELNINFFLVHGDNLGLIEDIKNNIRSHYSDCEFLYYSEKLLLNNIDIFYNEVFNNSLFEKEKIIFINQGSDKLFEHIQNLFKKNINQKIFIFSEYQDKKSKIRNFFETKNGCASVACYPDDRNIIRNIILQKLSKFKGLSKEVVNLILDNSGLDRLKLNNELNKIIIYFKDKQLDLNNLYKLLDDRINDSFNNLKDAAINGDKKETNKLLCDTIIEQEKASLYFAIINLSLNKLNQFYAIEKKVNVEKTIDLIKPKIFWKDKPMFIQQTKKWNSEKIKTAVNLIYNTEIIYKSKSYIPKNVLIKKTIIDICNLASAA